MVEKFYTIEESGHCKHSACDFVYSEDEVQTAEFTEYLKSHEDYGKKYEKREFFRPANCKVIRERTPLDRRMEVVDGEKIYEHVAFEWEGEEGNEPSEAKLPSPMGLSMSLWEEYCKNPDSDVWEIHMRTVEEDCIQLIPHVLKRWSLDDVLILPEGNTGPRNPSHPRWDLLTKNGFKLEAEIDLMVLCDGIEWVYYTKKNNPDGRTIGYDYLLPDGKTYRQREFVAPGPSWFHDLESKREEIKSILESVDYRNRDLLITRSSLRGYPFYGKLRTRHYDTISVYSIGDYYARKEELRQKIIQGPPTLMWGIPDLLLKMLLMVLLTLGFIPAMVCDRIVANASRVRK